MSDDNDLHDIRMAIGAAAMDASDALTDELIESIAELKGSVIELREALIDAGMNEANVAGLLVSAAVAAIREGEGR